MGPSARPFPWGGLDIRLDKLGLRGGWGLRLGCHLQTITRIDPIGPVDRFRCTLGAPPVVGTSLRLLDGYGSCINEGR